MFDEQNCRGQNGVAYATMGHGVSALRPPEICLVERACSAFHDAHSTVVALIDSGAEIAPELWVLRDEAFEGVRRLPARTQAAVREKHRVLRVMRDWLAVDNSEVAAFAFEVAAEAVALFDVPSRQACSRLDSDGSGPAILSSSAERRKPLSWFIRSRQTSDTPFAS